MTRRSLNARVRDAVVGGRRKRAVAYLRVSTPGQVNTDYDPEGLSIPSQRVAVDQKANQLQADIVREFVEPGKTATSIDKRSAFPEMLAWVKAQGDIDYIIVYHFNGSPKQHRRSHHQTRRLVSRLSPGFSLHSTGTIRWVGRRWTDLHLLVTRRHPRPPRQLGASS